MSQEFPRLVDALKNLKKTFPLEGELDLVRAGAMSHNIKLSLGGFFTEPEMTDEGNGVGAYNARGVKKDEDLTQLAQQLVSVASLTVVCEDYRQSAQAVQELKLNLSSHKDAVLAMAGGPTQPREGENAGRHQALVEFILAFHEINPQATINLIAHDQRCGGHAHFIGTAAHALETEGKQAEDRVMIADLKAVAQKLVKQGLDSKILSLMLARVGEDNSYGGLGRL